MINRCCCCIPLRAGVIIIAGLSAIASIIALVWMLIRREEILAYDGYGSAHITAIYYTAIGLIVLDIVGGLLGVLGATMQKRGMVGLFKFIYWILAILALVVTVAAWITLLVKRNELETFCTDAVKEAQENGTNIAGLDSTDACANGLKGLLIGGGFAVIIGNMISIYFACIVTAYASRLKRSYQHHPLRDLEDFPQTSYKTSVY